MQLTRHARRLKINVRGGWHCQKIGNALLSSSNPAVLVNSKKHVRWVATIGNEDRPPLRRSLRLACILIEFPARQFCNDHCSIPIQCSNVPTSYHIWRSL